jgi:hypothetical protein
VARSNHNKTEKRLEKIISWRRHHLRLDAAVRKQRSPCRHVNEDADAEVAVFIFNGAVIPPLSFIIAGEKKEKIKL